MHIHMCLYINLAGNADMNIIQKHSWYFYTLLSYNVSILAIDSPIRQSNGWNPNKTGL